MLGRLYFLITYVGSAALVAFLAACLSSPQVDTFSCHEAKGTEHCEVATTLTAFVPEAGGMNPEYLPLDVASPDAAVASLATATVTAPAAPVTHQSPLPPSH